MFSVRFGSVQQSSKTTLYYYYYYPRTRSAQNSYLPTNDEQQYPQLHKVDTLHPHGAVTVDKGQAPCRHLPRSSPPLLLRSRLSKGACVDSSRVAPRSLSSLRTIDSLWPSFDTRDPPLPRTGLTARR